MSEEEKKPAADEAASSEPKVDAASEGKGAADAAKAPEGASVETPAAAGGTAGAKADAPGESPATEAAEAAKGGGAEPAPVGENPAAPDIGDGNAAAQGEAAKENAADAQERGVSVNPGEVAETVKALASDAPAETPKPAPAAAPEAGAGGEAAPVDPEREAKLRAAAEARAARAAAKAAAAGGAPADGAAAAPAAGAAAGEARPPRAPRAAKAAEDTGPKEPSPNQPLLDRLVAILKESVGDDAIEEAYINEMDGHRPCVIIKNERWPEAATVFRDHTELKCDYLRNLGGNDMEAHLEVVYHLLSLTSKREYGVKVKTDRETPSVPSVTPVWATANWNERETYDLFGIDFPGHPDLRRIMMPDDWVGYPLRKDYVPLDPEV